MKPPEIGLLTQRVRIERRTVGNDAGEAVEGPPELVADVWAYIEPLAGREYYIAAQVNQETSYRLWTYWRDDLPISIQFRLADGRLLHPTGPVRNWEEANIWLVCDCAEHAA